MTFPRASQFRKNSIPGSVFPFVVEVVRPFRWYLCGIVMVMIMWSIDLTLRPYLVKWILNAAMEGSSPAALHNVAFFSTLFCVTLAVVVSAFRLYDWLNMHMQPALRQHIADRLMHYVLGHSNTFYQKHMSGALADHINNIARGTPELLKVVCERFLVIAVAVTVALATLARFHGTLALIIAVWAFVFILVSFLVARRAQHYANLASKARSEATGCITDIFSNMMSVRLFVGEAYESFLVHQAFEKTMKAEQDRDWLLLKVQAFHTFSFLVLEIVTLTILVRGIAMGWVTPGDFSSVLGINFSLIWVLWGLMQDLITFIKACGEISQGLKVLTVPYDMVDAPHATALQVTEGKIVFDHVVFGYSKDNPLFTDISITIQGGQKVGLVGYSGSGKSTFVNLILRLYDLQEGKILIDNQDIAQVTQHSLRKAIALIPQDPSLFHRTLRDNIRYGRQTASDADIVAVARYAHADEFIEKMSHKYETLVGERGLTLSGGQRQRIAIARAFLKEAPILLLDEATSALDSITESYIQDSLEQLMQGRTTLIIAHRLSTLMHMDRILVFDRGQIVEDGSHAELLAKKGHYYTLWSAQVNGFLPDHS